MEGEGNSTLRPVFFGESLVDEGVGGELLKCLGGMSVACSEPINF